jgi:hypothetical protein
MAKSYRVHAGTRLINGMFRTLTRLGLGASYRHILGVRGRKSRRTYQIPVDVMQLNGHRYLVAGYGVTNWVRNVRASGEAILKRGRRSEHVGLVEISSSEAPPILRQYIREVPVTKPYFDATPSSPDDELVKEAARHPVFRITGTAVH